MNPLDVPVLVASALLAAREVQAAIPRWTSVSPRLRETVDLGRSSPESMRHVVVGLALRDRAGLDAFLAEVQDRASPHFHRFLTSDEFTARYAPTPEAEATVIAHLEAAGLTVTERFGNRLLLGAVGPTPAVERAFGLEIHDVLLEGARHFAAIGEPVLPADVGEHIVGVLGLDDLAPARAHLRARAAARPRAAIGEDCCHLGPADVANLYDVPATPDASGQTLVIAGVYRWKPQDVTAFDLQWRLPELPDGSGQICAGHTGAPGCRFSRKRSFEAALDVEYAHATAPGARVVSYMAASRSFSDLALLYNRIVVDEPGHVVVTSWGGCEVNLAPATQEEVDDELFASGNAIGQAWFAASGDHGSEDCRGEPGGNHRLLTVDHPANSPHVVAVGGTSPLCRGGLVPGDPACAGYGIKSAWAASGGGASQVFPRPAYQTGCGVPAGLQRLVPDVALEADPTLGNYMVMRGHWFTVGGTSAAVAMWGGFFSRVGEPAGRRDDRRPGPPALRAVRDDRLPRHRERLERRLHRGARL